MVVMVILILLFIVMCAVIGVNSQQQNNSNTSNSSNSTSTPYTDAYFAEHNKWLEIQEKVYKNPIVREHFDNIEKIEMQYSVLYNLKAYFSPEMDALIKLCERDIEILPQFKALYVQYGVEMPYSWGSFKRLCSGKLKLDTEGVEIGHGF